MYNVVFRNKQSGTHRDVVTWTTFISKEAFDKWNNTEVKKIHEIVDEGVSVERAIELCSTPMATAAAISAMHKERIEAVRQVISGDN